MIASFSSEWNVENCGLHNWWIGQRQWQHTLYEKAFKSTAPLDTSQFAADGICVR